MSDLPSTTGTSAATPVVAGSPVPGSSLSVDDILAARERIRDFVHHTPLFPTQTLGRMSNTLLWLKAENLQRTGSFKARGGLNAVLQLSPAQKARGVVTMSAGNHGQGLAFAAGIAGVRCVVFMPRTAVPTKVEAIRAYGAEARFSESMTDLLATMEEFQAREGLHFVHPFADPHVIAGQATVALEIMEALPEVEALVAPAGGGGLLCGCALVLAALRPETRLVGVEPEGAAVVSQSLAAGKPLTLERIVTEADGLAAPFAAALNQAIIAEHVDDMVILTDDEIVGAMRLLLDRAKLVVEPAGAAAVAALLTGKAGIEHGARTVAILSGGNIDRDKLRRLL